ncbi:MAG: c-type cytochrome [Bryobacteraceae bacterium]
MKRVFVTGALFAAAALIVSAQAPPSPIGKKSGEYFKNVKLLKDVPAEDMNQTMHLISGDLGVECEFCHIQNKWDLEDVKEKEVAREMIKMTDDINRTAFKGKQEVTCYTCHQGRPEPHRAPQFPMSLFEEIKQPATLPTVDAILSKYVQALGGEAAIRKVTSLQITATGQIPTGPGGITPVPANVEKIMKAPNLMVYTAKATSQPMTVANGVDGKEAWNQDARGRVAPPLPLDGIRAKRMADIYEAVNLKKNYTDLKVRGLEKINGREVYMVMGTPEEKIPEFLFFDVQTGLLVRRVLTVPTAVGPSPWEFNYEDYRDAGSGVKYPYTVRTEPAGPRNELATRNILKISKIQENVALDNAKFVKPESKEPPPGKKQ